MYKDFFKEFYKKYAFLRYHTVEEFRKEYNIDEHEYDMAGVGVITDNQILFERTKDDGRGVHGAAFADLSTRLYNLNYDLSNFNGIAKAQGELLRNNVIEIRMINEYNDTKFIVIPYGKISLRQYKLFEKFVEIYSDTFKQICDDLDEKIILSPGLDGDDKYTDDLSTLLPYLESIIDYSIVENNNENIIGEEYEILQEYKSK